MWQPQEGGTSWKIDQRPFSSHSKSVEDLQWSPTEATVRHPGAFKTCIRKSLERAELAASFSSLFSAFTPQTLLFALVKYSTCIPGMPVRFTQHSAGIIALLRSSSQTRRCETSIESEGTGWGGGKANCVQSQFLKKICHIV